MPSTPDQIRAEQAQPATTAQVWLARGAFALAFASAAALILLAGPRSLAMVVVGAGGVVAFVAGAYWFLAERGVLRVAAAALAVAGTHRRAGALHPGGPVVGGVAVARPVRAGERRRRPPR